MQLEQQSFYAVSPMATQEGFIIQYLPQRQSKAQQIITQLQDRLVPALVGRGHLSALADSSEAQPSATGQPHIQKLTTSGPLAPVTIPHDDHPVSVRLPGPHQNAVTAPFQNPILFAVYTILGQWFTMPFCPFSLPLYQKITHMPILLSLHCHHPNNHNLSCWLHAFQQLFRNMAWDRWRYQNGISQE